MKKLGSKGMKTLKILHIALVSMWAGGALAMMATMLFTSVTSVESMHMRAQVLKVIDDVIVTNAAIGCIITALLYGIFTNWGFFKQRWITAKWILTIIMMLSGTFLMGPLVNANVDVTDMATYMSNVGSTLMWGYIQVTMLVIVLILSVWKPKMK